ncbi:uncharacterized protein LOC118078511 [Zootoca vivipara]|uniref:uncharacterized protein LOC118078511 n=1 Tax=Zootoca vivipara TaxID=8524 RepID=UPI00293BEE0A|nr:uncharacterized protein LOC118078511 [Zootoca vivipara]
MLLPLLLLPLLFLLVSPAQSPPPELDPYSASEEPDEMDPEPAEGGGGPWRGTEALIDFPPRGRRRKRELAFLEHAPHRRGARFPRSGAAGGVRLPRDTGQGDNGGHCVRLGLPGLLLDLRLASGGHLPAAHGGPPAEIGEGRQRRQHSQKTPPSTAAYPGRGLPEPGRVEPGSQSPPGADLPEDGRLPSRRVSVTEEQGCSGERIHHRQSGAGFFQPCSGEDVFWGRKDPPRRRGRNLRHPRGDKAGAIRPSFPDCRDTSFRAGKSHLRGSGMRGRLWRWTYFSTGPGGHRLGNGLGLRIKLHFYLLCLSRVLIIFF